MATLRDWFRKVDPRRNESKRALGSRAVVAGSPAAQKPSLDLEGWLKAAQTDARNSTGFFDQLLNTELYSVATRSEDQLSLVGYVDKGGEAFFPLFWKREDVPRELPPGAYRVAMPGRGILELARGQGRVVLNPSRAPYRVFSIEDITSILDRLLKSQERAPELIAQERSPETDVVDPSADLFKLLK